MTELRLRRAARAVILDPGNRILLTRFDFRDYAVWATIGGGIDEGETDEQALRRELEEEAGLTDFELGPLVWRRTHHVSLESGRWDGQEERVYLVRTPAFEPAPRLSWEQLRAEGMTAMRWWTLDELEKADELLAPRSLPELVRALVEDGPPEEPVDVGL